jgi:hypothetical protein
MMGEKRHPLDPWIWLEGNAPDWVQGELAQEKEVLGQLLFEKQAALTLIGDIAYDRDGYITAEDFGKLIDEIYDYARHPEKATALLEEKEQE